jgi:hypothetical protein
MRSKPLSSVVCCYSDFSEHWYGAMEAALQIRKIYRDHPAAEVDFVHRKFWEWCVIAHALNERGVLKPEKHGLGFAVGMEPLPSFFAAKGCHILATDLDTAHSDEQWLKTKQHADCRDALYYSPLVSRTRFDRLVSFRFADMRSLSGLRGKFDFIWSSCALEHLGSLQAGLDFILASGALLKRRGVAVHTTEFNVKSDTCTIEEGANVIYRRRDILALAARLRKEGFHLATPCFDTGSHPFDLYIDRPPYMGHGKRHLKLELGGHICTSFLLIIERELGWPLKHFAKWGMLPRANRPPWLRGR